MKGSIKSNRRMDMDIKSFYEYKDFARTLILQFKDSKDKWLAPIFLYPFKLYLRIRYYHYDVVYVPSSKEQQELRGYVPNELILESVFSNYIKDAFTKEDGYKQSLLSRELRVNVRKSIKRNKEVLLQNKKVLLFDDIVTTGNSLKACYDLLIQENKEVKVVVLFMHN